MMQIYLISINGLKIIQIAFLPQLPTNSPSLTDLGLSLLRFRYKRNVLKFN